MRNSNLELLRIISMLLIVAHHCSVHGFTSVEWAGSFNKYIVDWLSLGGKLGVNCFVLISGYFMVNSRFTVKKLLKLTGAVWFYSVASMLLFCFLRQGELGGLLDTLKSFFPILYKKYWFMTVYVVLMLLSPFLNHFIHSIDRKMYQKLIALLVVLWSVMKTLIASDMAYNNLGWFIMLYLIAGYIRLYVDHTRENTKKHFSVAGLFIGILIISVAIFNTMGNVFKINAFLRNSTYFAHDYSFILLIIAVELLIGFVKMKPHYNTAVNLCSGATLGVYLIHDNEYVRTFLWQTVFKLQQVYDSPWLFVYMLGVIVIVYIICTGIDLIRQYSIEKIYLRCIDKIVNSRLDGIEGSIYTVGAWIKNKLYN